MHTRLIRLAAALVLWLCMVFLAPMAFAQGSSLPVLMTFQPGDAATDELAGVPATLNTDVLLRALPGTESEFIAPNGMRYVYVTDSIHSSKIGTSHWVAHLRDAGSSYRAIISYANGVAFGTLTTTDGSYRLQTQDAQLRLLDLRSSSRKPSRFNQEPLIPPAPPVVPVAKTLGAAPSVQPMAAAQSGLQTIDLMVLYTHGLASKLGLDVMQTRIEHLVAVTNQAYVDSLVNIQLRLVHSAQVTYSDQITHNAALQALTDGVAPFAGVASLRSAYGADVVTLLNQFDTSVDSACGLAWLLGSQGASMNANYAFSVVSVGDDIASSNAFCSDYTLAHELGHNMGSVHDRANTSGPGAFPYSYGYGISGRFGDIMSYISPGVGKFSNPAVTCGAFNDPCGVSEADALNGANTALSLNNKAATVAAFAATKGLDTTPSQFGFTALTGVSGGGNLVSEVVTLSGISTTVPISVSGGEYSINGGAFTNLSGTVSSGQSVQMRVMASATPFATATAMLTVGTVSQAFKVVTKPAVFTSTPAVAAGFAHSVALRADGVVWAWGDNAKGALGDGTSITRVSPVLVAGLAGATAVAAAGDFSLALKADGSVWGWGNNTYGQLGNSAGTTARQAAPVAGLSNIRKIAAAYFDALAIDSGGAVWRWGNFSAIPAQVSGISSAVAVAPGQTHRMALLSDGSVRVWGGNSSGQLGLGHTTTTNTATPLVGLANVIAIAAGSQHSLALRADGTVWAWGGNSNGQLGDGTTTQRSSPVPVLAVGGVGQLSSVVAIAAGQDHSMAIKSDGTVVVWGQNTLGQLGDGTVIDRAIPVALALAHVVGITGFSAHTLALLEDGSVWAWGLNNQGNLGDGSTSWRKAPVLVGVAAATPAWFIGGGDMEPNVLSLGSNSAPVGAVVASGPITVGGINQATPISIFGGEYSVDAGAFTALPGTVNAGQTVSARVTTPAVLGASTTVWLTIGGVSASFTVTAANTGGTGLAEPVVSLAATALSFNSQSFGRTSAVQTVKLTNTGAAALSLTSINSNADFAVAHNCGSGLGAEGFCNLSVTFTPTSVGNKAGVITIASNAAGSPHSIGLSGTGIAVVTGPPSSVSATAGMAQATVRFTAPVDTGGSVVTGYTVMSNPPGGVDINAGTTALTHTITGLTNGTAYTFTVVATNVAGISVASAASNSVAPQQISQLISFGSAPTLSVGGTGAVAATGGASTNAVTFTSTTPSICTVAGSTVTALTAGNCLIAADQTGNANYTAAPQVTQTITIGKVGIDLLPGWNLMGNASDLPVAVDVVFADKTLVNTVWKWDSAKLGWQFYTPTLTSAELQIYAEAKGYGVLASINQGEGFWVNANTKVKTTLPAFVGAPFYLGSSQLVKGWNLAATAADTTPSAFNLSLTNPLAPPPTMDSVPVNLTTLWAWDNPLSKWYFYSPSLDGQGGTALTDYIAGKGYLDFTAGSKTLGGGSGFWVNRP